MYKSFQIKSNYDQLKLDGIIISCENPKGIVQISHGMCEHKERYIDFMNFLSNQDVVLVNLQVLLESSCGFFRLGRP